MKRALLILLLLGPGDSFARAAVVFSNTVSFAWDYPTNALVPAGSFRLYWGPAARGYTNFIEVTSQAVTNTFVQPLGSKFHVAVTAIGVNGLESDYSADLTVVYVAPFTNVMLSWFGPATVEIQTATTLAGPWQASALVVDGTNLTLPYDNSAGGHWFRAKNAPVQLEARLQ